MGEQTGYAQNERQETPLGCDCCDTVRSLSRHSIAIWETELTRCGGDLEVGGRKGVTF